MLNKSFLSRFTAFNQVSGLLNIPKFLVTILFVIGFFTNAVLAQPIASGQSKFLGASSSYYFWRYFDSYWNQLSPGNDGKWGVVSPSAKDTYNWTNLDKLYNYATSVNRPAGFQFKQHAMVWGQQAPGWIASLDSATQRASVENWFKLFGQRYPLTSLADVVNEPFHAVPSYAKGLGGPGKTGWDWVITSFELARKYLPATCKLILNEYNVLHDNTVTANYINLIKLLNDKKLIDGIGIQGHYFEFRSSTDDAGSYIYSTSTIKANLDRLGATGLPVYITEFDVDESKDATQLEQYKIYFPLFWTNPYVKGITLWGYINDDIWSSHPYTYLIKNDGAQGVERPALQWLKTYISTTDVKNENEIPVNYELHQNYPNPFNPTTTISFSLPKRSDVDLRIYDMIGKEVMKIVFGSFDAGTHYIRVDGSKLTSGVYFYKLQTAGYVYTKKMVLVK